MCGTALEWFVSYLDKLMPIYNKKQVGKHHNISDGKVITRSQRGKPHNIFDDKIITYVCRLLLSYG